MILFVRHGETDWNVARRLQGQQDSPLTPRGERQALAMAELVAELVEREPAAAWRLVASPLGRAQTTAAAIATRLGLAAETDARLAEMAFGEWEGRLHADIAAELGIGSGGREWLAAPPGGEPFATVQGRADAFLKALSPEPARRVIAVGHGMLGRAMISAYAGLPQDETLALEMPHGSVFRLTEGQVDRFDSTFADDVP